MSNLESAIRKWRQQMQAAGIKQVTALDELESHLREEIGELIKAGLDETQALTMAVQKIGQTVALNAEFRKIRRPKWHEDRRLSGKLVAAICAPLMGIIFFLGWLTVSLAGMSVSQELLVFAALALNLLVACQWRHAVKFLPLVHNPLARFALTIGFLGAGVALFGLFTNFILPHDISDDPARIFAGLFWAFLPLAAVICLATGFMMSQREREIFGVAQPAAGK